MTEGIGRHSKGSHAGDKAEEESHLLAKGVSKGSAQDGEHEKENPCNMQHKFPVING